MTLEITPEEQRMLKEEAGLLFMNKDEDGFDEWAGTDKEWVKYEELVTKFKEENNIPF